MTISQAWAGALCALILIPSAASQAQTKEEFEELKQQLRALQERTQQLERRLVDAERRAAPATKPAAPAPRPASVTKTAEQKIVTRPLSTVSADADGFVIKSEDNKFELRLGGTIHADGRFVLHGVTDDTPTGTFVMRRVRPIFEGHIYDDFGFRLMPDFAEGKATLQDAYIEYTRHSAAELRVGKFKMPVGLERLQSSGDMLFVERGLPSALLPNRDVGVQLSGEFADEAFTYAIGVFNGAVDGSNSDLNNDDNLDGAARIWLQPWKASKGSPLEGLQFGVAGTYGAQNGALPSYRSAGQQSFFTYVDDADANGTRWRVTPQAYYSWGPFGVLTEYVRSGQEVRNATGTTIEVNAEAWQIAASWVLTGENASFDGVEPRDNFGDGGWGSLELAARYGELHIDGDVFDFALANRSRSANAVRSFGLGLNWKLNRNVRAMLDYDHSSFSHGSPDGDRPDENVILTRLQLSF